MIEQDWIYGFAGGLMIGMAAVGYLLINGRILGASGILGGLVDGSGRGTLLERGLFMGGLIAVPGGIALLAERPDTHITSSVAVIIIGGLMVGFGTRLGSGCTSGHGVCGISRFSLRGITATIFYLLAGGATMLIFRQMLGVI